MQRLGRPNEEVRNDRRAAIPAGRIGRPGGECRAHRRWRVPAGGYARRASGRRWPGGASRSGQTVPVFALFPRRSCTSPVAPATCSSRRVRGSIMAACAVACSAGGAAWPRLQVGTRRGEGMQDLLDIVMSNARNAPCGQPSQQSGHVRPQVDEDAHEAAGLRQGHGLFQGRERARLVSLRVLKQRLQRQHLDGEARVVDGRDRKRAAGIAPRRSAPGWQVCSVPAGSSAAPVAARRSTPSP